MSKEEINNNKLDIIIFLLVLNIRLKEGFDEKTTKQLVKLLMDNGYKWRDVTNLLNISSATITKIIKK